MGIGILFQAWATHRGMPCYLIVICHLSFVISFCQNKKQTFYFVLCPLICIFAPLEQ